MDPKHITRTGFCNKEIDNVTDNSMKKYILDNTIAFVQIIDPVRGNDITCAGRIADELR